MRKTLVRIALISAVLAPSFITAQTFTAAGEGIPDDGNTIDLPLVVTGLPTSLDTISFGLERVCLTIAHPWMMDLDIRLVAPDGTSEVLMTNLGGGADLNNTCFTHQTGQSILTGNAPYTGEFRPQGQMGRVNNGQIANGTWHLRITDIYPFGDEGNVTGWSMTFGSDPAGYFAFVAGDLPLLVIDTDGGTIALGEKIPATMGIVDNGTGGLNRATDPFNGYDGLIGIDIRGNSSQWLSPKKSYGVELRDTTGADLDAEILGMPAESDWILSANYFDKSFLNNALTFQLSQNMGNYAPRYRHVELFLNNEYQGVYVLMERIKRGADRVDIAKLDPDEITGDDLTGGYIVSVDRPGFNIGFTSEFSPPGQEGVEVYMQYRYPKPEDIVPEQAAYISNHINVFETALDGPDFMDPVLGYRAFIDVPSFIDLFLINEFSKNIDGYRLSTYLYKDKDSNGGNLHAGPVWDYDIAWGNADYCDGSITSGWAYEFGDVCGGGGQQVPFWWSRLLEDPTYANAVGCRWNELRETVLSPSAINAYCDSMAVLLDGAQRRNFAVWPTLGYYVWPNPTPLPTSYAGEIAELKDWALDRWNWLDENLSEIASCNTAVSNSIRGERFNAPYPDPFIDHVTLNIPTADLVRLDLLDMLGRPVHRTTAKGSLSNTIRVDLPEALPQGSYILRVEAAGVITSHRLQH